MQDRQSLRNQLRARRAQLDPQRRAASSALICEHLANTWLYRRASRIAFYFAQGKEVNLDLLLQDAWTRGKQVFMPILGLRYSGQLWFVPCEQDTPIYKNRFGIDEPVHASHMRRTKLRSLDLLLMPLVGFDLAGNRLGMGGGFYDKTLAGIRTGHNHWTRPKRIGIAYAMQGVETIPGENWDVPLDAVVTENGLQWFTRGTQ
ncbi:MAG: 5-formyltetrahydrofolate cyclo-ligase [Gammaproteobacteria bacterium]